MPMMWRTPEEFRAKIYSGNWGRREFAILQDRFGDEALFQVLYLVFCDPDPPGNPYVHQEFAGSLLLDLSPSCPISAVEFLRTTLPNWNRSVEQLPFYVERKFGHRETIKAIESIESDPLLSESLATKLSTCRYWLREPLD